MHTEFVSGNCYYFQTPVQMAYLDSDVSISASVLITKHAMVQLESAWMEHVLFTHGELAAYWVM